MNAGASSAGDQEVFGIQHVASQLGITARALRFYEDQGLVAPVRLGVTRVYGRREIGRMQIILRAKRLGFSLREIEEFLTLYDIDPSKRTQMAALARSVENHLAALDKQREAIDITRAELVDIRHQIAAWMAEK